MRMVIISCMSVAVSDFGVEWLLGGNVLCNVVVVAIGLGVFYIRTKSQSRYK